MKHIAIIVLLAMGIGMHAQPVTSVKYDMMIDVAEKAAANYDYYNAIDWFNKAYKESKDKNIKVAVGDLYMKLRDYRRAERTYGIVLRRDKDSEYQDIVIDYIEALRYQGKTKEAMTTLKAFAVGVENDSLRQLAQEHIKELEAMESMEENIDIVVGYVEGDINSGSGENSPVMGMDNALYYSSFNRKTTIDTDKDEDYHAEIYKSVVGADGSHGEPSALEESVNRPEYHNSGVSFSSDGRVMYLTRIRLEANEIVESEVYTSVQKDDGWSGAQPLTAINGDYLALHPYEGELYGDKVLFFTSDMDGGYGGYDLYYSKISGDSYGPPINLGESINTAQDEITPSYHNGYLYFSTNGRGGLGGYDIFKTRWSGEQFEDITNMGHNYNSYVDDTYFRLNKNGKSGYLVSNRPSDKKRKFKGSETCCDDIYFFQKQEVVVDLLASVVDENGALDNATVDLIDLSVPVEDAVTTKTNLSSNEFQFLLKADHEYRLKVSREGYIPDSSIVFNTAGILDNFTIKKEISLAKDPEYGKDPNKDGETTETQVIKTNEVVRLNNIYYDFNKWDILPSAEEDLMTLQALMLQYPSIVIELSSHTDSRGKSPYNQSLSQKRAESAKAWLVTRGIDRNRIKAVGYGESMILNGCVNGKRCSDEEHAINRRTEFKVLEGPETIIIERKKKVSPINLFDKYEDDDYQGSKNSLQKDSVPMIKFVENNIDLGDMIHGESKEVVFHFVNTGNAPLNIRLVSACKCTDLSWPRVPVLPGESGRIKAVFHTKDQKLGAIDKTLDIIADTDPIVVEAFFHANILPQAKVGK